jgi:hypothetical protein
LMSWAIENLSNPWSMVNLPSTSITLTIQEHPVLVSRMMVLERSQGKDFRNWKQVQPRCHDDLDKMA